MVYIPTHYINMKYEKNLKITYIAQQSLDEEYTRCIKPDNEYKTINGKHEHIMPHYLT